MTTRRLQNHINRRLGFYGRAFIAEEDCNNQCLQSLDLLIYRYNDTQSQDKNYSFKFNATFTEGIY